MPAAAASGRDLESGPVQVRLDPGVEVLGAHDDRAREAGPPRRRRSPSRAARGMPRAVSIIAAADAKYSQWPAFERSRKCTSGSPAPCAAGRACRRNRLAKWSSMRCVDRPRLREAGRQARGRTCWTSAGTSAGEIAPRPGPRAGIAADLGVVPHRAAARGETCITPSGSSTARLRSDVARPPCPYGRKRNPWPRRSGRTSRPSATSLGRASGTGAVRAAGSPRRAPLRRDRGVQRRRGSR